MPAHISTIQPTSALSELDFMYEKVVYDPLKNLSVTHLCVDSTSGSINNLLTKLKSTSPTINGYASHYCGHQFGTFNPALGDGRTLTLNRSYNGQELQMKGTGLTPFSYGHDGRLTLKSALREYINCHMLEVLTIPTVSCLAVIKSEERLQQQNMENAALLLRSAPSFLRIGHLEYLYQQGKHNQIQQVINYCSSQHFSLDIKISKKHLITSFFTEVIERSANLIAHWQASGFYHGSLNSDNFSLLGLTLDTSNSRFLCQYEPLFCSNSIDHEQRYAFTFQPRVAQFNLQVLAQCLSGILNDQIRQQCLARFMPRFHYHFARLLTEKLGLIDITAGSKPSKIILKQRQKDSALLSEFLQLAYQLKTPYWKLLSLLNSLKYNDPKQVVDQLKTTILQHSTCASPDADGAFLTSWLARYHQRLALQEEVKTEPISKVNPIEQWHKYYDDAVISAQRDDLSPLNLLLRQLIRHQ